MYLCQSRNKKFYNTIFYRNNGKMNKKVKTIEELKDSRLLFDNNPPAFGYIFILIVAIFFIAAVGWSIKTPKTYIIQAQGIISNEDANSVGKCANGLI